MSKIKNRKISCTMCNNWDSPFINSKFSPYKRNQDCFYIMFAPINYNEYANSSGFASWEHFDACLAGKKNEDNKNFLGLPWLINFFWPFFFKNKY